MAETPRERARRRVQEATAQLANAIFWEEVLAAEPNEPAIRGHIKFQVDRNDGNGVYTYFAWRAPDNYWYVTGYGQKKTWGQVLRIMRQDVRALRDGQVSFFEYDERNARGTWRGRRP